MPCEIIFFNRPSASEGTSAARQLRMRMDIVCRSGITFSSTIDLYTANAQFLSLNSSHFLR